ncbi:VirB8 family type IV secretion system protein [Rickettsiales endosymbiont of Stachyamoeba lipophora]|uniref:virB8 family protein n=1 Tax=Rickettsiales endosymbiont of Stachyamoeba lipophora TaxID=2486578 RepID=UPI000F6546C2|nr:type IV secretion system protein [Rickettsiales endosymbiont of Stachyamoeba lipophora]AZL16431.1 hypothetical protein EF513_07860 [Rickettsiales endosymbiont of Stachyamoeba lipophora]
MLSKLKNKQELTVKSEDVVGEIKNWYYDRYSIVLLQRNLLVIVLIIVALGCLVGVIYLREISLSRTIKPFVIQVEDNTGITTVVDSVSSSNIITRNESIKNYFVIKYIRARETYSEADYKENYDNIARILSSQDVYLTFRRYIGDEKRSPITKYADKTVTTMQVRSIQYNDQGDVATVRFKLDEAGRLNGSYNKIATVKFSISPMTVSKEEMFINPIGFKVTSYRVDDEILP